MSVVWRKRSAPARDLIQGTMGGGGGWGVGILTSVCANGAALGEHDWSPGDNYGSGTATGQDPL